MWKEAYRCPSHAACKRGTYQRSHTGLLGRQMWHQKSNALAAGTHSIWGSRNNARQGSVGRPQHKSARMATRQAHILSSSTAEEQPPPPARTTVTDMSLTSSTRMAAQFEGNSAPEAG